MTESERLAAIEEIRQLKAKYWRGVDTGDAELVRSILCEDCVLDYRGCWTDPVSGTDYMPAMNIVMEGRASWSTAKLEGPRIVTVHLGHQSEVTVTSTDRAEGIWYFTDHFFMPPGHEVQRLHGFGRYYDTYIRTVDGWQLETTRIERIRAEAF